MVETINFENISHLDNRHLAAFLGINPMLLSQLPEQPQEDVPDNQQTSNRGYPMCAGTYQ